MTTLNAFCFGCRQRYEDCLCPDPLDALKEIREVCNTEIGSIRMKVATICERALRANDAIEAKHKETHGMVMQALEGMVKRL